VSRFGLNHFFLIRLVGYGLVAYSAGLIAAIGVTLAVAAMGGEVIE
jgi:hypothetical protein